MPNEEYFKHLKNYVNEKDVRVLSSIYSIVGPDEVFRLVHASCLQR